MNEPSWRKTTGVFAIIGLIALWSWAVVMMMPLISSWPILAQMPVYLVAGIAWILPLKPLLRWMETGHFRP